MEDGRVNILGTWYSLIVKKYDDDPSFEKRGINGYCDDILKDIVIGDMKTWPQFEDEQNEFCNGIQNQTLRHEIVHAFLSESGLQDSAARCDFAWSKFEECIDWFAIQGPKIYTAWKDAGAL